MVLMQALRKSLLNEIFNKRYRAPNPRHPLHVIAGFLFLFMDFNTLKHGLSELYVRSQFNDAIFGLEQCESE